MLLMQLELLAENCQRMTSPNQTGRHSSEERLRTANPSTNGGSKGAGDQDPADRTSLGTIRLDLVGCYEEKAGFDRYFPIYDSMVKAFPGKNPLTINTFKTEKLFMAAFRPDGKGQVTLVLNPKDKVIVKKGNKEVEKSAASIRVLSDGKDRTEGPVLGTFQVLPLKLYGTVDVPTELAILPGVQIGASQEEVFELPVGDSIAYFYSNQILGTLELTFGDQKGTGLIQRIAYSTIEKRLVAIRDAMVRFNKAKKADQDLILSSTDPKTRIPSAPSVATVYKTDPMSVKATLNRLDGNTIHIIDQNSDLFKQIIRTK